MRYALCGEGGGCCGKKILPAFPQPVHERQAKNLNTAQSE